jgi:hypothetical protein
MITEVGDMNYALGIPKTCNWELEHGSGIKIFGGHFFFQAWLAGPTYYPRVSDINSGPPLYVVGLVGQHSFPAKYCKMCPNKLPVLTCHYFSLEQAVKLLCKIWQPNHIPEEFLTSSHITVIPSGVRHFPSTGLHSLISESKEFVRNTMLFLLQVVTCS